MNTGNVNSVAKWLRRLGRGLSLVLVAGWLFVIIMSAFDEPQPPGWEGWFIVGAVITAVIVTAVAWWRSGLGGLLLIIFGLFFSLFGYFSAGQNQWFAVMVSGFPFVIIGALFLISCWLTKAPDQHWTPYFE